MIHKIERIVSIGKYRNYQAVGQVNFHKLTLIYGDNGSGKTTLTSIFRSLNANNPELIRRRISSNHTVNQAAQIVQRTTTDTHHTFHHTNGWNTPLNLMEIFDVNFVNDNIFSGHEITEDHKRQLHQFVIGSQGIAIQQAIEQNKRAKTNSRLQQTNLSIQIFEAVGNSLTNDLLPAYLALTQADTLNTENLLATAQVALTNANSNAVIQSLQLLTALNIVRPNIDFDGLERDLQATTQTIQDAALQTLFEQHCTELATNSLDVPETWLASGFRYVQAKNSNGEQTVCCPFCKQTVDQNSDIFRAFLLRFNTEFNALLSRMQNHLATIQNFNLDLAIQEINNSCTNNSARIETWRTRLPETQTEPTNNIFGNEELLRTQFRAVTDIVQQKIQNPSAAVPIIAVTTFRNSGRLINQNIETYNTNVGNYNTNIATFRSSIQTVEQARTEVQRLTRLQKRFLPEVDALCENLKREIQNTRTLETTYSELTEQQESEASTFFTNYGTQINHYLSSVFKTHFRIEDVRHVAPQGRALQSKLAYKLTLDGKDISFDSTQPFSTKDCLSEGDKSTIALAFFLSKLDLDTNRNTKILIFDDPLSSLDTNRRVYTVRIIKRLCSEMGQVIVLSHNEYFLHEISRDFGAADLKTLRITENFATKESKIEECDLDELAKSDYFKQLDALERFRVAPDHLMKDAVLGWLRTVLEAHLKFKFYREIRTMTTLKTFGNVIRHLDTTNVVFNDNAHRVDIIGKLRMINDISWMPHHGNPMPDQNAMTINPMTITAPELDGLIQDTLELISQKL